MQDFTLKIYNTRTRQLEVFSPLHPPKVGLYVCGPTVYGHAHLGHARSAIAFDIVVRTLQHLGYQVRYVRNITDVGHLMGDADHGKDKIGELARLTQVSPMEVAQKYTHSYHTDMALLNVLPPSIEPCATGHITEQIAVVQMLLDKGFAYVANGSVYFDVVTYHSKHSYGILSGRKVEDLMTGTRTLQASKEKRSPLDFALWKKATPNHLMHWPSPWGDGFPGWHLECTAMSTKYLGTMFDIHGGGLDLCFPHHECEIAQSKVAFGVEPARYWMHNNLVTIQGQKMSKSLDNFISLDDCFTGRHTLLTQAYSPMVLRFFMLQAHYRSPLSFSNHGLQAARKGYYKLMNGYWVLKKMVFPKTVSAMVDGVANRNIKQLCQDCYVSICHDFNTAKVIAHLFDLLKYINRIDMGNLAITSLPLATLQQLKNVYSTFIQKVLGLDITHQVNSVSLIESLLQVYAKAKSKKDYELVDTIRQTLKLQGIVLQDKSTGVDWRYV